MIPPPPPRQIGTEFRAPVPAFWYRIVRHECPCACARSSSRRGIGLATILVALWVVACGNGATEPIPVPNRAPTTTGAVPNQSELAGESVLVDMAPYFADPDGDALTYTAVSSDAGVASVSIADGVATVATVAPGVATITVTANDLGGLSAQLAFSVTVHLNVAGAYVGPATFSSLRIRRSLTGTMSMNVVQSDDQIVATGLIVLSEQTVIRLSEITGTINETGFFTPRLGGWAETFFDPSCGTFSVSSFTLIFSGRTAKYHLGFSTTLCGLFSFDATLMR